MMSAVEGKAHIRCACIGNTKFTMLRSKLAYFRDITIPPPTRGEGNTETVAHDESQRPQAPLLHSRRFQLRLPDPESPLRRVLRPRVGAARWGRDRRHRARSLGTGAGRALRLWRDRRVLAAIAQPFHGAWTEDVGEDARADQRTVAPRPSGAA